MFKTGHFYHFFTAAVFIGMGCYFWFLNPDMLSVKGINPAWFGGIMFFWGMFRGINAYLMLRRKRESSDEN